MIDKLKDNQLVAVQLSVTCLGESKFCICSSWHGLSQTLLIIPLCLPGSIGTHLDLMTEAQEGGGKQESDWSPFSHSQESTSALESSCW